METNNANLNSSNGNEVKGEQLSHQGRSLGHEALRATFSPTLEDVGLERATEIINERIEDFRQREKNVEKEINWRKILTDLKDSIDGDGDWKQRFIDRGYDVTAITSNEYDESVPELPKAREFMVYAETSRAKYSPRSMTVEDIKHANAREDLLVPECRYTDDDLDILADNGITKANLDLLSMSMFYENEVPAEDGCVHKAVKKYFGGGVPDSQKDIMGSIIRKVVAPDFGDKNATIDLYSKEIDFLAKNIAIESDYNVEKIDKKAFDRVDKYYWDKVGDFVDDEGVDRRCQYDMFLTGVMHNVYSEGVADLICEKARQYAANPDSIKFEEDTNKEVADREVKPFVPARPDQKKIMIDIVDKHYPYMMPMRRGQQPKMVSFNGFSRAKDGLPNVERVGFAGETIFDNNNDTARRIDETLGRLFNANTISFIEKQHMQDYEAQYPNREDLQSISSEIGDILASMKSDDELVNEKRVLETEIKNSEHELFMTEKRIEEQKEAEARKHAEMLNSNEYRVLTDLNKMFEHGGRRKGLSDEHLEELAGDLIDKGYFDKLHAEFSDEEMKKIGVFENSLTYLGDEDDHDVASRLFDDIKGLAETYCSGKELSDNQEELLAMAHYRGRNMRPFEREDLLALYSSENDNDILAKMLRSSVGVDVDIMKSMIAARG